MNDFGLLVSEAMAIQYKKIIKEIMGSEAKKHGFKIGKNGPAGISKRNLAVYEKKIDEIYTQSFEIEYDSMFHELTLWAGKIRETSKFENDDEASFRKVVNQFEEIMKGRGYQAFIDEEAEPRFTIAEQGFLLKNYRELSACFYSKYSIDCKANDNAELIEKLEFIVKKVDECRGKEFADIKENMIEVAAFYTELILNCADASIEGYKGFDNFTIVKGNMGVIYPLNSILSLWTKERKDLFIYHTCRVMLTNEQFDSLELEIEK